jgi:hypothetical protein
LGAGIACISKQKRTCDKMGMPRYFIAAAFAVILIVWLLVAFIG